jgi:hypothetical protein
MGLGVEIDAGHAPVGEVSAIDSARHAGMKYEELLQRGITLGLSYEPQP